MLLLRVVLRRLSLMNPQEEIFARLDQIAALNRSRSKTDSGG